MQLQDRDQVPSDEARDSPHRFDVMLQTDSPHRPEGPSSPLTDVLQSKKQLQDGSCSYRNRPQTRIRTCSYRHNLAVAETVPAGRIPCSRLMSRHTLVRVIPPVPADGHQVHRKSRTESPFLGLGRYSRPARDPLMTHSWRARMRL